MRYISDEVDSTNIKKGEFNLIASGTGTGKSTFILNNLLDQFPDVKAKEVMFITSRSMIVEQQSKIKGVSKIHKTDFQLIDYWNGELESKKINQSDIGIMTYDILIDIIKNNDFINHDTLENVKIIILDECHTIFSDDFINDIDVLKVWTSFMIKKSNKIFIGLTATPHIIYYAVKNNMWGVKINQLNESIIINYHVNNLLCTDFNTIPYLILNNTLKGKTIIMCYTVNDCYKLKEKIPNSAVLISKNNKLFNDDMNELREYIINNSNIPQEYTETIIDQYGKEIKNKYPLKVLITTSTLREGINIQSSSNVKNVVSCLTDDLHIIQFAGRCRHNLDNLVVADTYVRSDNRKQNKYLSMRREQFKRFLYLNNDEELDWFNTIKHILNIPIFKVNKVRFDKKTLNFIDYMNKKWLIPIGEKDIDKYYIYKKEDKQEIINNAIYNNILKKNKNKITFNQIIDYMQYSLGYKIQEGRTRIDKKQTRYKLIIEYDKEKGCFHYLDCSNYDDEEDD